MTRSEQINIIVDHFAANLKDYKVPKGKIITLLNESIDLIKVQSIEDLKKGEKVDLFGFGAMTIKNVSARQYRNIQTGQCYLSPAGKKIAIKPSKPLKEAMKQQ